VVGRSPAASTAVEPGDDLVEVDDVVVVVLVLVLPQCGDDE